MLLATCKRDVNGRLGQILAHCAMWIIGHSGSQGYLIWQWFKWFNHGVKKIEWQMTTKDNS